MNLFLLNLEYFYHYQMYIFLIIVLNVFFYPSFEEKELVYQDEWARMVWVKLEA